MPKALDFQQLTVTHSPTQRIDLNTGKLPIPQLDLSGLVDALLGFIKDATGLDLSALADINPIELLLSLPDDIKAIVQLVIDTILSALTKIPVIGGSLDDLFQALHLIPPDSVQGAAGPANMFDSIFGIIDSLLGGFVGAPGATGGSAADLTNVAGEVASNAYLGGEAWRIASMVNNTPTARGFLPTGRANFEFTTANTFVPSTQSAALSASIPLMQAMPIGVISWYGYGTSGMTAFYVNIRKVNPTTGVRDLVYHSPNLISSINPGSVGNDGKFMFCELSTPIAAGATDTYYVEFVPVGSGTHYIRGISFSDTISDHPTAPAPCVGTTVNYSSNPNTPAASLAKATAGPNVAWVEYAVAKGAVNDHHEPTVYTFDYDGESIVIPSYCDRVDLIGLGKGGTGAGGLTIGFMGEAGAPGKFMAITLVRGTDFTGDSVFVTFNVLSDGSAKLSIPSHSVTAPPGANGGSAKLGITSVGHGPGVLAYNGQTYTGGVDQAAAGGAGQNPGGGGNGGKSLFGGAGGVGGKAAGWVCFRQTVVVGETATGDTTPPTAPTITLSDRTFSTITVTVTGGTD